MKFQQSPSCGPSRAITAIKRMNHGAAVKNQKYTPWALAIMHLVWLSSADAAVVFANLSSTTVLAYSGQTSTTDLINAGQSTLSSATVSVTNPSFPGTGINNGNYSNTFADNTFFQLPGSFPATATYDLNVTVNVLGYDLTSIKSFMGWATVSAAQANQTYTIEVSTVGSASYTSLATVAYKPFSDTDSPTDYETFVTVSDTGGVLATGVDSIRFTFTDPIGVNGVPDGSGAFEGTLIREIDVFGSATIPEPSAVILALGGLLFLGRRRR
jgi:hypothetical protein